MNWLRNHIRLHPFRVFVILCVLVLGSMSLAGLSLVQSLNSSHDANVRICLSLNELRRELYVAAADLGVPPAVRQRFLPSANCENLP